MSGDRSAPTRYEAQAGETAEEFDVALAQSYVGRTIIVGLTYLDHLGNLLEHRQIHGEIVSADREAIRIALAGKHFGETWSMPPDLRSIESAPAGEYRFRETGEIVVDPDLMANWTINKPPQN